ncbi:MAG: hypothetical protein GDA45_02515 [Chromatiales bacterium]|nr:hypothetical protein [Chromatiales bacterium]
MVKRNYVGLYALAVCFINVLIGSIAIGVIIYSIVGVVAPHITLPGWEYSKYQSNDEFILQSGDSGGRYDKFKDMTEQEITRKRNEAYDIALKTERRQGQQEILEYSIVLLIQIILFVVHWRLVVRNKDTTKG